MIVDQSAQDAGAALSGFEEQEHIASVRGRKRFGCEFLVLELELGLDGTFERRLEGRHLLCVESNQRGDEQTVPAVLDERNDALVGVAQRIIRVVGSGCVVLRPVATFGVEDEPKDALVLAPGPSEVDSPDGRGLPELKLQKLSAVLPAHESGPF